MKFANKIEPFESAGERAAIQLLMRRYTAGVVIRSPGMAAIHDYRHAEFTFPAFGGAEKEPQRKHIATTRLVSTRGDTRGLPTSCDDLQDGRQMFLLLVEDS